jgi:hypothetical protein
VLWSGVLSSKDKPTNCRKLMRSLRISSAIGSLSPNHFCISMTLSIVTSGQCGAPPWLAAGAAAAAAASSLRSNTLPIDAANCVQGISRSHTAKKALARGPPRSAVNASVNVGDVGIRCINSF